MVIFTVVASKWNRWDRREASPDPPAPSSVCTGPNINLAHSHKFLLYSLTRSFVPTNAGFFFCRRMNATTVIEPSAITERLRISILIIYTAILVVSVMANILVVLVLWRKFKRHRKTTRDKSFIVVVSNQVVSHLVFVIATIPVTLANHSSLEWSFGPVWCKIVWPLQAAPLLAMVYSYVVLLIHQLHGMKR